MSSEGLFVPHTSSIDFCEKNYEHFYEVVELHNTWSSLAGISLFGLIGLWKGNPTREWRYFLGYFILFLIGVGSAGLHGTLHWVFQSSDELPMIYLVTLMNFITIEVDSPHGKPKYPFLPLILNILMVANTLIYFTYQHLYLVFIATNTFVTVFEIYLLYTAVFINNKGGVTSRNLCKAFQVSYFGGFLFWLVDMFQCDSSVLGKGMTFHVLWHFGAGFGGYLGLVALENCRVVALDMKSEIAYVLGFVPYVKLLDERQD